MTNEPCHYTWAFKKWKLSLFGGELKYRNFIQVKQYSYPTEFTIVGNPYKEELFELYRFIQKVLSKNIWSIRKQEIDKIVEWVIANSAAYYYLHGFNNWFKASIKLIYKDSLSLSEKKQISQLERPITIFESNPARPNKLRVSLRTGISEF